MAATPELNAEPSVTNHFAWIRTYMAIQRTQLAAIRTATTLIAFGFTVAQFFQKLLKDVPEGLRVANPAMPRNVGLVLIAAGVFSLGVFTLHFRASLNYMRSAPFAQIAVPMEKSMRKPAYWISYVVMAIGVLAFGSVFLRF
jgi:putative membrane protein